MTKSNTITTTAPAAERTCYVVSFEQSDRPNERQTLSLVTQREAAEALAKRYGAYRRTVPGSVRVDEYKATRVIEDDREPGSFVSAEMLELAQNRAKFLARQIVTAQSSADRMALDRCGASDELMGLAKFIGTYVGYSDGNGNKVEALDAIIDFAKFKAGIA